MKPTPLSCLRYLLSENDMTGADLAQLLKVHRSTGYKILKGKRNLTVSHIKKLCLRFSVEPSLFIHSQK